MLDIIEQSIGQSIADTRKLEPHEIDEITVALEEKRRDKTRLEEKIRQLTDLLDAQDSSDKFGTIHVKGEKFDAVLTRTENVTYKKEMHGGPDPLIQLSERFPLLSGMITISAKEKSSPIRALFDRAKKLECTTEELDLYVELSKIRSANRTAYFKEKRLL